MPRFLVAVQLPRDYDPYSEDETTRRDISALNEEMIAAGVRLFVGGLEPPKRAKAVRVSDSKMIETDGPYVETKEHIGGFWVLEAADMDEALEWGRKATVACRVPVEIRQFLDPPGE